MLIDWNLSDRKSLHVSKTLLHILADLNNAEIWMVLIRPPISNSTIFYSKPLGIIPIVPITIGWLVGFYGISTFVGYLTPNPF